MNRQETRRCITGRKMPTIDHERAPTAKQSRPSAARKSALASAFSASSGMPVASATRSIALNRPTTAAASTSPSGPRARNSPVRARDSAASSSSRTASAKRMSNRPCGTPASPAAVPVTALRSSGRAIMAIRNDPIAAAAMGINTALYKTLTFGVSALYTGVAGTLSAIVVQFVASDSFSFFLGVSFLVGLVIGGVGSIAGCLVGGLFVLYVPNIAESVSTGLAGVVYGVILLLVIFVMPDGAAGFARLTRARLARATQPLITKGRSS